jgi:hypothetical protein
LNIFVRLFNDVGETLADLFDAHAHAAAAWRFDTSVVHIQAREALVLDHEADPEAAALAMRLGVQVIATVRFVRSTGQVLAPGHAHFLGARAEPGGPKPARPIAPGAGMGPVASGPFASEAGSGACCGDTASAHPRVLHWNPESPRPHRVPAPRDPCMRRGPAQSRMRLRVQRMQGASASPGRVVASSACGSVDGRH